METTSVILVVCSLAAIGSACCTPAQWEGVESVLGGYANRKHHGLLRDYIFVSYDATNNRSAAFVNIDDDGHPKKLKVITRYDNGGSGKLYVIDIIKDKCWTKTLQRPFRRACIPHSAKYLGNYSLGLAGGFNLTSYEISGRDFRVYLSVEKISDTECVPVGESVIGRKNRVDYIEAIGFVNITPGIKNETVFDIPELCKKSYDATLPEELTREYDSYILAL